MGGLVVRHHGDRPSGGFAAATLGGASGGSSETPPKISKGFAALMMLFTAAPAA
jgi:hypothetical protein